MSNSAIFLRRLTVLMLVATLAACAARRPAPVVESRPAAPVKPPVVETKPATPAPATEAKPVETEKVYVIQKGDTLISIALANGLDYRELAMWNNIDNPNVIKLGDTLRLSAPVTNVVVPAPGAQPKPGEPVATPLIIAPAPVSGSPSGNTDTVKTEPKATKVPYSDSAYIKMTADAAAANAPAATPAPPPIAPVVPATANPATPGTEDVDWAWPIQPPPKGKIIANFTDANKGIDISGTKNASVLAAANGKVVYAGAGLRGYGRLVIIKHNNTWLSAYAHNEKILVAEGQDVKKGQKIAEMGNSDTDQVKLHFEIRKQGKPVDPVKFLPN
ncbi:MAG: peptidoglycan DD-metalloendopeptidase family protein [Betaproteobacteria bacterium]|nr:peptidoglycan DD-metalloendopeptidase family protein [Betaproteobacteria bacterium]